ncbi:ABC transporter permease [Luteimonas sp. R10]|uniref:ABC transporter permease n=1 Tax=Luteimonas sp. R10 TaxID=3108176 RepID=UPI00308895B9|nr:ABC transporter permease [Luteimonas sp. R10]
MSSFLTHLRDSTRFPEFWAYSSWLDIVTKYRRTRLGLIWIVVPVAVFVAAIGSIYSRIMGHDPHFYIPYLAVGYVVWRFMVQCTNESASILRSHKSFIMDGRIRLSDFVLRSLSKAFFYFVCSLVVIFGALAWSPDTSAASMFTMLLTFPLIVANMLWWSTCMALVGARHADAGEMINTALRFGMLLTPILWVGERFPFGSIGWWAVHANPGYHLINVVRAPLLGQEVEVASLAYIGIMMLVGWLLAVVLYRRYARFVPLWI